MCGYNRYMVELRWARSVRAAQSDMKEDLHAAELKYTVLNVFNGFNYSSMFIRINVQYNIIQ